MMATVFSHAVCAVLFAQASATALRSNRESYRDLQNVGTITGFNLITNQVASSLSNGDSLAANGMYNVQAVGTGPIGSVKFDYTYGSTSFKSFRTEGVAPYAFCGDSGGTYRACNELSFTGEYTITATPYESGGGGGAAGTPVTVIFSIGDASAPIPAPVTAPIPAPITAPVPVPAPVPAPVPVPVTSPVGGPTLGLRGNWEIFNNQNLAPRHEACFVMVGDNGYLMGGRESRDVDIFSASSRTWSKGQTAPDLLHHMQCVGLNGKIYLPAAWTGFYPREDNADVMWVYDTGSNRWSSLPAMKSSRRRGSAAIVVDGTKIWVSHGNRGGHEQGNFATSYGWIDYFDTATNQWTYGDEAGFPDAPNPRDHTGGGLVNGRICVSGGRDGGLNNWPAVSPTDCYDPVSNRWSVEASIPQSRSGSSYGTSCDGKLIIAGGERNLSGRVDVFDGRTWSTFANGLNQERHGSGLAVDCNRNLIYIASGSPNGGGGNTRSMEIYTP